eukprot:CAMPEP_0198220810 /NCGR_PEP_ID=MMETSP1445-20131203/80804_1 /TAXON_ID=36898 /ORGANISM="Pyramimonas sp., Strain CCMP2087" /LENGTH=522 /DNA_ID=CAMNT_0043898715 /DNA_START=269 /DNA_END=1837 /DNA_ORIENTATION=-
MVSKEDAPLLGASADVEQAVDTQAEVEQKLAWRLSARRPIYAVLLFLIVIIGFESLGKDGWELGFVAKERLDESAQWVDMIDGDSTFLGKYVQATDERVTFMGRFTANQTEGSVQFDNTGTVFGLQFRRSAMLYVFYREPAWPGNREDSVDVGFGKYNARAPKQVTSTFRVWIDGVEQEQWMINPLQYGDAYLFRPRIQDVLGYDEWQTVVFQKVSETTYSYGGTLVGFLFESTAEVEALPSVLGQKEGFIPPPIYDLQHYNKRRLEFIGDSWMSGFSIRSKVVHIPYDQRLLITRDIGNCQEPGIVLMTDSSLAYPIQAARLLKSGYVLSGVQSATGLARQYGGFTYSTLLTAAEMFESTFSSKKSPWEDWDRSIPHAVVVSTGKNDFSKNFCQSSYVFHSKSDYNCSEPSTQEQVAQSMVDLVVLIRARYPDAEKTKIVLVCETSLEEVVLFEGDRACAAFKDAAQQFLQQGVHVLDLSPIFGEVGRVDGWTCQAHPSPEAHRRAAVQLAAFLRKVVGWL